MKCDYKIKIEKMYDFRNRCGACLKVNSRKFLTFYIEKKGIFVSLYN